MDLRLARDALRRIPLARRAYELLSPLNPSHMWGRVFDLDRKVLLHLDGFDLYVMPNDYIGAMMIRDKTYEPHVTAVIKRELSAGDTFLDVGANIGYFSMFAASVVGATGKVFAVEPNPQNLQLLYESQLANGFGNLTIYPYAVSDHAGLLRFTTVGSNGGVVTDHSVSQKHFLLVQARRMDDLLAAPVDMIKIDIEAHEPFALAGMSNLLASRPKLITEFHPWAMRRNNVEPPVGYLEQIDALGYRIAIIQASGETLPLVVGDIMPFWERLGEETAHLDLYCAPA
jgi:FkbM family methyltransferase